MCQISYAATWYINPNDGGSVYSTSAGTNQCNGLSDIAYSSGVSPNCRLNSLYLILKWHATNESDTHGTLRVSGGDTIIADGPLEFGYDATSGQTPSPCTNSVYNNGCFIDTLPAGIDATHPTKLMGRNAGSCTRANMTQLYGYGGVKQVLYETTSNIEFDCLEITDHYYGGSGGVNDCSTVGSPVADAVHGIQFNGASNVTMNNVWVHGLCANGVEVQFASGTYTLNYVDIMGNPLGGWNQAFNSGSPNNSNTLNWNNHIIDYNGCAEAYPLVNSTNPDVQANFTSCGFGNGNGVGYASGNGDSGDITMVDGQCSHNQDSCLDNLHASGSGKVTVSRMKIEGNGGQTVKLNASPGIVENSQLLGNCGYMNGQSFSSGNLTPCRANDTIALAESGSTNTYKFTGNTIISNNDVIFDMSTTGYSCTSSNTVALNNNIVLAGTDFYSTGTTPGFFTNCGIGSGIFTEDYDQIFNTRGGAGDVTGAHSRYGTPLLSGQSTLKMTTSPYYQGTSGSTLVSLSGSSPSRFAVTGSNAANTGVTLSSFGSNDVLNTSRGINWDGGAMQFSTCVAGTGWCNLDGDCCNSGICSQNMCSGGGGGGGSSLGDTFNGSLKLVNMTLK